MTLWALVTLVVKIELRSESALAKKVLLVKLRIYECLLWRINERETTHIEAMPSVSHAQYPALLMSMSSPFPSKTASTWLRASSALERLVTSSLICLTWPFDPFINSTMAGVGSPRVVAKTTLPVVFASSVAKAKPRPVGCEQPVMRYVAGMVM